MIQTEELSNPEYQKNTSDRCYHCKTELFTQVEQIAERMDVAVVADGSNRDDHGEHRPGLRAAKDQQGPQPAGRVRVDEAGDPRIGGALGTAHLGQAGHALPEQPHRLRRSGHARAAGDDRPGGAVPARAGLSAAAGALSQGRHGADRGLAPTPWPSFSIPEFRREVVEQLKALGFKYVSLDLEGFRSGSMNAVLAGRKPADPQPVKKRGKRGMGASTISSASITGEFSPDGH